MCTPNLISLNNLSLLGPLRYITGDKIVYISFCSPMGFRERSHHIRQGRVGEVQNVVPLPATVVYITKLLALAVILG
jgi:hypothetical protein